MSANLENTYPFTDPDNYTFDTSLIEVDANGAALSVVSLPGMDSSEDFSTVVLPAELERVGDKTQQIDQRPAGATFGANFSQTSGNWGEGDLTMTLGGEASIAGGKLVLPIDRDWCTIDGTGKANPQYGSYLFSFIPNKTVYETSASGLVAAQKSSISTNANAILTINTSGEVSLYATDSVGSFIGNAILSAPLTFVIGQEYKMEFHYDYRPGQEFQTFYIDGVRQLVTNNVATMNPLDASGQIEVGAKTRATDYSISDFMISSIATNSATIPLFSSVADTAYSSSTINLPNVVGFIGEDILSIDSYLAVGDELPTVNVALAAGEITRSIVFDAGNTLQDIETLDITYTDQGYSSDSPSIDVKSSTWMDSLLSLDLDYTVTGSDVVKMVIIVAGQYYYWTGSAWAIADGTYAQSSTIADVEANVTSLDLSSGYPVKYRLFLESADHSTTPIITGLTVGYRFYDEQDEVHLCLIYFRVKDIEDNALTNAKMMITGKSFIYGDDMVCPNKTIEAETGGMFRVKMVETETTGNVVNIDIVSDSCKYSFKGVTIPNQATADLSELV